MTTLTGDPHTDEGPDLSSAPQQEPGDPTSGYAVLRWLVLATFVVILNETVMLNALSRLAGEFSVSVRTAQWLTTSFMLTMATVIPVTGWFLQRVTTRVAFATAMSTFAAGTLLAALAPAFSLLLAGRVVQAAGTAVMLPLLMTTLMTVVPEHDRGRVMGNVTLAISVAPAMGPVVSGLVLEWLSWRWMFGLVLPVAVGITVLAMRQLTNHGEQRSGPIDWFSVLAAGLGFGSLVYGLSQLGGESAGSLPALPTTAVGLAVIGVFVWRQVVLQRVDRPLLDLRTLSHPTYAVSLVLMSVGFMAMLGAMILLPLYLQQARVMSELQSGLVVMPGGLLMGLMGPTVGRWFDRFGGRVLVIPGSVGMLLALATFTLVATSTPVWMLVSAHMLLMVSLALVFTPVFTLGLGALPPHLYSHGSSLLSTLQQVAAAVGTAVVVTVMSSPAAALADRGAGEIPALVGGMQWAFGVGAVLAVVVVALGLRLPARVASDPHAVPLEDAQST